MCIWSLLWIKLHSSLRIGESMSIIRIHIPFNTFISVTLHLYIKQIHVFIFLCQLLWREFLNKIILISYLLLWMSHFKSTEVTKLLYSTFSQLPGYSKNSVLQLIISFSITHNSDIWPHPDPDWFAYPDNMLFFLSIHYTTSLHPYSPMLVPALVTVE